MPWWPDDKEDDDNGDDDDDNDNDGDDDDNSSGADAEKLVSKAAKWRGDWSIVLWPTSEYHAPNKYSDYHQIHH